MILWFFSFYYRVSLMIKMKRPINSFFHKRWTFLAIIYSLFHFSLIINFSFSLPINREVKYEVKHHFSTIINYQFIRSEQNTQKTSTNFGFFPWFIDNINFPRLFFYKFLESFNFSTNKLSPSFFSVNRARAPPFKLI